MDLQSPVAVVRRLQPMPLCPSRIASENRVVKFRSPSLPQSKNQDFCTLNSNKRAVGLADYFREMARVRSHVRMNRRGVGESGALSVSTDQEVDAVRAVKPKHVHYRASFCRVDDLADAEQRLAQRDRQKACGTGIGCGRVHFFIRVG